MSPGSVWSAGEGKATHSELLGLPAGSDGKESTCNAGDLGSIPGWEDPIEEEIWVWLLVWEYTLEEGMATHSSIPAWRIPMDREAWQAHSLCYIWNLIVMIC